MKIFLSQNSILNPALHRFVVVVVSVLLIVQAFLHLASSPMQMDLVFFLNLFVLLIGFYYLILGVFLLSSLSNYAPRVEIEDTSVLIRNHPFQKSHIIDLNDISKIKFGSFEVTFIEKQGSFNTYRFNTRKVAQSLKIKEELRKKASLLNIEVDDEISAMVS